MGALIILFLIFIVTVVVIIIFPPNIMSDEESFKASVKDLWGIVKICQTASFGQPTLELKPAKRSVLMDLHFLDADRVSMSLPLKLKKQQQAKAEYLELFDKHNLIFFELKNNLTVHLNRQDENFGEVVAHLYREIFDASDADTVKFKVKTLNSDMRTLRLFSNERVTFNADYTFEAPSARHKEKSVLRVQTARILNAVSWLLYPLLIVLSYKFFGIIGMCKAALIFFGFFAGYRIMYQKEAITDNWGNLVFCLLLSATLVTNNIDFLQSIPSATGGVTAIITGVLALGLLNPKSKKNIMQKTKKPREFKFMQSILAIGGIGLFLMSEWARRNLDIDQWIWFFGFVRIELMIAMVVVFTPAYALFLKVEENRPKN